ncbi:hypothetical protein ACLOJK_009489 [Asimina triloba]
MTTFNRKVLHRKYSKYNAHAQAYVVFKLRSPIPTAGDPLPSLPLRKAPHQHSSHFRKGLKLLGSIKSYRAFLRISIQPLGKPEKFLKLSPWEGRTARDQRNFEIKEKTSKHLLMKIVKKDLIPDGPGSVKMIPEESDDLWHVYNLVSPGDSVFAVTVRKIMREAASGGRDAERVKLKLEIKVEAVDYDKEGSVLRIRGKNVVENEHVKIGQFHTLEIEQHRPFVLRKNAWDSLSRDILQQASAFGFLTNKLLTCDIPDPAVSADLAVVLNKFFENVLQAFLKHIDFKIVRCAVIASPGFTKTIVVRDSRHTKVQGGPGA